MKILPHVLDVSIQFQPIHSFVPNNSETAPFIGLNSTDTLEADWTPNIKEISLTTTLDPIPVNELETSTNDIPGLPPPPPPVIPQT